jgi:type I restriction enzyme S subunit
MNADRLLKHYEQIADAPDAIARLRRFILDLAVRGKLVPQDRNDEPASELLKRIEKEKARLVKAGEIRKPKPSAPIADSELLIELPPHWAWARLYEIGNLSGGMTPSMNRSDFWGGNVVWLSPKDIKSDEVADSELKISELGLTETRLELYRPGCLFMVARSGILKRTFPVSINRVPAAANQDIKVLAPFLGGQERYLQIMFRGLTDFLLRELVKTGTTVQSLKYAEFEQQPFPLPPLAEQHRIVAKVDELMGLCDRLEAARAGREATRDRLAAASLARLNAPDPETFQTDARFVLDALPALTTRPDQIKRLRQTILNLAVRGKLVPQDPNDEPASELLKRIAEERADLVKRKEFRREEALDPIQPSEMPFDVPTSWVWSRIGEAVLFTQYGTSEKSNPSEKGVPVLTMGNIQDGLVVWNNEKRIPETSEDLPALYLQKFDLLYNRTNSAELVGKTGIYIGEDGVRTFASYLIRLRPSLASSNPHFLNMAMNAPEFRKTQIVPLIKKQTGQANVNGTALKNMLIPLPPLAAQHRIVAKVDELMGLCDRLEASLTATAATRRRLLDALLAEALGPADVLAA